MLCPRCQINERAGKKPYCNNCYAAYVKDRRAMKKDVTREVFVGHQVVAIDPALEGSDETVVHVKPEITWYEKARLEHEEWKKGKCIFCFQPSKVYHRRNGAVELCVTHACA